MDYDELLTSMLDYFGSKQVRQRTVFVHVHVDGRLIKCFQGFSLQNDSFVKFRDI